MKQKGKKEKHEKIAKGRKEHNHRKQENMDEGENAPPPKIMRERSFLFHLGGPLGGAASFPPPLG